MTELLETRAIGPGPDLARRAHGRGQGDRHRAVRLRAPGRPPRLLLHPVQATVPRGRITAIDTSAAEAVDGVLTVLTHLDAQRLAPRQDRELAILQDDEVAFRGQLVAVVVAETSEPARHAAEPGRVEYAEADTTRCPPDHPDLYAPEEVNPGSPDRTPRTATSTRRWRPPRSRWSDVHHGDGTTTTRSSRTPRRPVGRRDARR